MSEEADFDLLCQRLCSHLTEDLTQWKQVYDTIAEIVQKVLFTYEALGANVEFSLTGSRAEGTKVYFPNDMGDLDIMIASTNPDTIFPAEALHDIIQHPGFVRVVSSMAGDQAAYVPTSAIKSSSPEVFSSQMYGICLDFLCKTVAMVSDMSFDYMVKQGASHKLEARNNLESPSKQLASTNLAMNPAVKSYQENLAIALLAGQHKKYNEEQKKKFEDFMKVVENQVDSVNKSPGDVSVYVEAMKGIIEEACNKALSERFGEDFGGAVSGTEEKAQTDVNKQPKDLGTISNVSAKLSEASGEQLVSGHNDQPKELGTVNTNPDTSGSTATSNGTGSANMDEKCDQGKEQEKISDTETGSQSMDTPASIANQENEDVVKMLRLVLGQPENAGQFSNLTSIPGASVQYIPLGDLGALPGETNGEASVGINREMADRKQEATGIQDKESIQKLLSTALGQCSGQNINVQQLSGLAGAPGTSVQFFPLQIPEQQMTDSDNFKRQADIDIVPAFRCIGWPKQASSWASRKRYWPSYATVSNVLSNGFHVVAKPPKSAGNHDFDFRLSFSVAERILFESMSPIQRNCLQVLKMMLHKDIKGGDALTTYHLKTALFHVCESTPVEKWESITLGDGVLSVLQYLMDAINAGHLQHYFIPACNLLTDLDPEKVEIFQAKLMTALDNPSGYLQSVLDDFDKQQAPASTETNQSGSMPTPEQMLPPALKIPPGKTYHDVFVEEYNKVCEELATLATNEDEIKSDDPLFDEIASNLRAFAKQHNQSKAGVLQVLTCSHEMVYMRCMFNMPIPPRPAILEGLKGIVGMMNFAVQQEEFGPGNEHIIYRRLMDQMGQGGEFDPSVLLPRLQPVNMLQMLNSFEVPQEATSMEPTTQDQPEPSHQASSSTHKSTAQSLPDDDIPLD